MDWRWMQTAAGRARRADALDGLEAGDGLDRVALAGLQRGVLPVLAGAGLAATHALRPAAWDAWNVPDGDVEGYRVFGGPAPLFMAQMAPGYFDLRGLRDRQGRDWWAAWRNAHLADQAYCARNPESKTYAAGFWGINASDQPPPVGYGADQPEDGHNDGTVAPTAMLAGMVFTPERSQKALADLWTLRAKIWGRYGFSNAFNVERTGTTRT